MNYCLDYINSNFDDGVNALVKETLKSVSRIAIIPIQDYLELDGFGRMNLPSTLGGNWDWRLEKNYLTKEVKDKIKHFTKLSGRVRKD